MANQRFPLEIIWSRQFRKDYVQAIGTDARKVAEFQQVLHMLSHRIPLPVNNKDHPLKGALKGFRDCHVRGDLVLIYRIVEDHYLRCERIGTHSRLGL